MSTENRARDLFIVDNSIEGWSGLRYLQEWSDIATSFDIATGYFEIGALLALDGKWQKLEKLRILMGGEVTQRTRKALLEAISAHALNTLNQSIEVNKETNPFLNGVPGIVEALQSKKIQCRVYDKDKFHAKAYITRAKLEVVGAQALVGSSNFTIPGMTKNVELNIQVQSAREVRQLQEWFDNYWEQSSEITEDVIKVIARQTHEYTPFEIYAKALQEYFRGHALTATEWDETRSKMFPRLDRYQKEAYWSLMKIARQHGGAFLCDGVGLGKTFVGLMLIERFILHEGKRVVLFAPKATKEGVWEPHLKRWLAHIGGIGGSADFSNLAVFSHTDIGRKDDFPERFRRIAELADVVIIDEAHHFRNTGRQGDPEKEIEPSRYHLLFNLLDKATRPKSIFMLTATPINNRLADFRHMIELFSRRDEAYFGKTLGINNLTAHFNDMERALWKKIGHEISDVAEHIEEAQKLLSIDSIFHQLVVQRSRSYARESQMRETGKAASFPVRKAPQVAAYSIRKTYGHMLENFEKAFQKEKPLFTLPMYYPLAWYIGEDKSINAMEEGRQKQVVALIRIQFLKRFESSVAAFEISCERLLKKLLAFLTVHSESDSEKRRLERWKNQNTEILKFATERRLELWATDEMDFDDDDVIPQAMLEDVEHLERNEFDVPEMMSETYLDMEEIVKFLYEARQFDPCKDDKLQKLKHLLKQKELSGRKFLIFTEFADTARYLNSQLIKAGIEGVEQIDSSTKGNRDDILRRFSPYYNESSSPQLKEQKQKEIRILISTDVLSEGLNLQDASHMINYDIHWNPVRLMQRIGRVDRRMNPEIEARLLSDHPELKGIRGKVSFWNFLPPEDLNALLTLYTRVTQKTLLISETLGIEGRKLLTPDDDYEALKEFNHAYEGIRTSREDLHLEYQDLIRDNPGLEERVLHLPGAVFSGREKTTKGARGVFFCYALPALDKENNEFNLNAGVIYWYLYDLERNDILEQPGEIAESIRSNKTTPRNCIMAQQLLIDLRIKVEKHIKNTYLKRVDAPIGIKAVLRCWMELD